MCVFALVCVCAGIGKNINRGVLIFSTSELSWLASHITGLNDKKYLFWQLPWLVASKSFCIVNLLCGVVFNVLHIVLFYPAFSDFYYVYNKYNYKIFL